MRWSTTRTTGSALRLWVALAACCAGCSRESAAGTRTAPRAAPVAAAVAAGPSPRCKAWGPATTSGVVTDPSLIELSGIAASRDHPGILWVHNDNGNKPRIYAIDSTGKRIASYKPKQVPNDDWEDIALGPCSQEPILAGATCLYIADTGDNELNRTAYHILRFAEPKPPAAAQLNNTGIDTKSVEIYTFTWPDGPEDCEAMAVLPDTRVLLFSKRNDAMSKVLRLTLEPGGRTQVESLGTLDLREDQHRGGHPLRVTAADLALDGRWLLLRTYGRVLLYDLGRELAGPAEAARDAVKAAIPERLRSAPEEHGEGIAWDPLGGFWQIAEGPNPTLWHTGCAAR